MLILDPVDVYLVSTGIAGVGSTARRRRQKSGANLIRRPDHPRARRAGHYTEFCLLFYIVNV